MEVVKLIFRGLIPIVLIAAGLMMLVMQLPGWNLIFGLPMVTIGVTFAIYTYDEVISKKYPLMPIDYVACSVCRQLTPLYPGVKKEDAICFDCHQQIERGMKKKA